MLVLSRYPHQSIVFEVGDITFELTITEIEWNNGRVKLGIDAPRDVRITRKEIHGTSRGVPRGHPDYRPRRRSLGFGEFTDPAIDIREGQS